MLAKAEQEVSISTIVTTTHSSIPIEVCQDLNVPLADIRTTFPRVVVSTIKVSLAAIILVSLPEETISIATLEPFKAAPIDSRVLIDAFPIILIVGAILVASTHEPIQTSLYAQT